MKDDVIKFYADVIRCENNCTDIWPNIENTAACPPRGFYSQCVPGIVDIMILGKNPGHLMADECYEGSSAEVIARNHFRFDDWSNIGNSRAETFHRNLIEYLQLFLSTPREEIFQRCVLTNLVKCSTKNKKDRIPQAIINQCIRKHLLRELNLWKPKVILTLGREVERALALNLNGQYNYMYVKHPSYHYSKTKKEGALNEIKVWVQEKLNSN